MDGINRTLQNYDPEEVKKFLDQVIERVEKMNLENKQKEEKIKALNSKLTELSNENVALKQKILADKKKLEYYERTESTFNKAIIMAQKTSDQMRLAAHRESETIIDDAKKNANRIVNEALLKAEKTELEANMLARNLKVYKRKIKDTIESQLSLIDDLDKIEM